jgi:hypothetical protein
MNVPELVAQPSSLALRNLLESLVHSKALPLESPGSYGTFKRAFAFKHHGTLERPYLPSICVDAIHFPEFSLRYKSSTKQKSFRSPTFNLQPPTSKRQRGGYQLISLTLLSSQQQQRAQSSEQSSHHRIEHGYLTDINSGSPSVHKLNEQVVEKSTAPRPYCDRLLLAEPKTLQTL